jgi:hypothetical protein
MIQMRMIRILNRRSYSRKRWEIIARNLISREKELCPNLLR